MAPGSDERQIGIIPNGHTTYSEKNNLRYLRLIRKYSSIIQGQFFGHLHSDSFRIVYNDMGKAFPSIAFYFFLQLLFTFLSSFPFFLPFSVAQFVITSLIHIFHLSTCLIRHEIVIFFPRFLLLFKTNVEKKPGKPVSWIMIAPSITPRKMLGGSNNPAMRLYKFETDTGQVSWKINRVCFKY